MAEPKHTPGPWEAKEMRIGDRRYWRVVAGDEDEHVADAMRVIAQYYRDEAANARLIAAAPDLLAACQMALDLSEHADGCGWWDCDIKELASEEGRAIANAACNCHLKSCNAAFIKAVGDSRE